MPLPSGHVGFVDELVCPGVLPWGTRLIEVRVGGLLAGRLRVPGSPAPITMSADGCLQGAFLIRRLIVRPGFLALVGCGCG